MSLDDELGFRVKDGQIQTVATRESDIVGHPVPRAVRPATEQEIKMYEMLEEISKR